MESAGAYYTRAARRPGEQWRGAEGRAPREDRTVVSGIGQGTWARGSGGSGQSLETTGGMIGLTLDLARGFEFALPVDGEPDVAARDERAGQPGQCVPV